jgi:hypothetical protein
MIYGERPFHRRVENPLKVHSRGGYGEEATRSAGLVFAVGDDDGERRNPLEKDPATTYAKCGA